MFKSLWPHGLQHARLLCPPLSPGVCSDSCPLSWWCYLTISSSAAPFSFCLQSFPASGSFPMSQLFAWGGPNIEVSASTSVLPMNIQSWFPLGLTSLISLQSKGYVYIYWLVYTEKILYSVSWEGLEETRRKEVLDSNNKENTQHQILDSKYHLSIKGNRTHWRNVWS